MSPSAQTATAPAAPALPLDPDVVAQPFGLPRAAASQLAEALAKGVPAPQALREAGAPEAVASFAETAAPRDSAATLSRTAEALRVSSFREGQLRSLAFYPLLVGGCALVLAAATTGLARPALVELARAARDAHAPVPLSAALPFLLLAPCLAALALLAFSMAGRRPLPPFRRERLEMERALLLQSALAALRGGATLPAALRAAAALVRHLPLRDDATAVADSLERGGAEEGELVFGALGAALFRATAAAGAGEATLEALAEAAEAAAAGGQPALLRKAEALSISVGALAVLAAGAVFVAHYSRALTW